jgi:ubiquinone/menaquinone biosynthesis C-methylase UbiE
MIRGVTNVEFRLGDIEAMPVDSESVDVVISNCVLNLVPDKGKAFREIYRVLKSGGRFSISDIVISAPLPEELQSAVALYTGCVAGALPLSDYLVTIRQAGFGSVELTKSRSIDLPDELLAQHLTPARLARFRSSGTRVLSVTVVGSKQN